MLAPHRKFLGRILHMAALQSLRVLPLSASQSPVSRGRNLVKFGPMEAPFCGARAGVKSSSSCVHNLRGVVRSAMGEEAGEGEAGSSGNGAGEQGAEERAPLVVVSFYKFANLPDYEQKRAPLKELCESHFVSGGIILAPEGINGSICGTRAAVEAVMSVIQGDERLAGLRRTEAPAELTDEDIHHGHNSKSPLGAGENAPFRWDHVRVKLKKEVVSMGVPGVNPADKVGKYVKPKDWNNLISDPNTVVVDVRNLYEIRVGKFKRAIDPQTDSFRQFPAWVEENLVDGSRSGISSDLDGGQGRTQDVAMAQSSSDASTERRSPRRIAMYCTGGIRCEKATSYLIDHGFDEVYHLEGGILKYLEETPACESLWEGECFVFDKRVAVGHELKQGTYTLCYACKKPVNSRDMESPLWEEGVSCPYCFHQKSEAEKARARARHEQFLVWGVIGGPGCSVATTNSWSLITPNLSSSRTLVCSASRRFLPVTSHARRARTKFSIAATPNEGDETEDPVTSSTSTSVSEETETFPTTPNSISEKRAKAEAEVKKGQRTAIVTGVISVLLGVGYLVLIQLLDTRGVILVPPPPEAFDP